MHEDVFLAIASMDAYNRDGAGLNLSGQKLGVANIIPFIPLTHVQCWAIRGNGKEIAFSQPRLFGS